MASDTTDTTDRGTPDFGGQLFGLRKSPSTVSIGRGAGGGGERDGGGGAGCLGVGS